MERQQHDDVADADIDGTEARETEMMIARMLAEREELCPPGTMRRALDERMLTNDGYIEDEEAEKIEREICESFGASSEASELTKADPKGICLLFVLQMGRQARNVILTRIGPDEVKAVLLEELPFAWTYLRPSLALPFVESVRAFFKFVSRELELPRAKECAEALDLSLASKFQRALELHNTMRWRDSTEGDADGLKQSDLGAAPLTKAERNRRKAQRRAQKASRRKNR